MWPERSRPTPPVPPALRPHPPLELKNTAAHHTPKRPPAADRVYAHVKQGVLERRYEGGSLLTEGALAEAVGVSRTPVREALLRLEAEGFIRLYPKKGALVPPVSAQEIADVRETRQLIEEHTARRAAVRGSPVLLERLATLLDQQKAQAADGDLAAAVVTQRRFHTEIVRDGGNQILFRLYDQLCDRQLRMSITARHTHPDRVAEELAEQEEILHALSARDAEAAAKVVRRRSHGLSGLVTSQGRTAGPSPLDDLPEQPDLPRTTRSSPNDR